jgi:hypothetical protein
MLGDSSPEWWLRPRGLVGARKRDGWAAQAAGCAAPCGRSLVRLGLVEADRPAWGRRAGEV